MKIYMIRHGKPTLVKGNYYTCSLSIAGKRVVKSMIETNVLPVPDLIITSPFKRAKETARIFSKAYKQGLIIEDAFAEWALQTLNLKDEDYFPEEKKGWKNKTLKVKGGESLKDVSKRAMNGLKKLVNDDNEKCLLIVAHGTVIDLVCEAISRRKAKMEDIKKIDYLDYAVIEHKNGKFRLEKDILD